MTNSEICFSDFTFLHLIPSHEKLTPAWNNDHNKNVSRTMKYSAGALIKLIKFTEAHCCGTFESEGDKDCFSLLYIRIDVSS